MWIVKADPDLDRIRTPLCGKCAIVCRYATIRMKVFTPEAVRLIRPPSSAEGVPVEDLPGHRLAIEVAPNDWTGCGVCVERLPAKTDRGASQGDRHGPVPRTATSNGAMGLFPVDPVLDRGLLHTIRQGFAVLEPLFEFSGAVRGAVVRRRTSSWSRSCSATASSSPMRPAVGHLRSQPADDSVGDEGRWPRPGVEQLVVRGQRRVRLRHAAGARRATRGCPGIAHTTRVVDRPRPRADVADNPEEAETQIDVQRAGISSGQAACGAAGQGVVDASHLLVRGDAVRRGSLDHRRRRRG